MYFVDINVLMLLKGHINLNSNSETFCAYIGDIDIEILVS